MCLSVPSFLHQEMGADSSPLVSRDRAIINEVIGADHCLSPQANGAAEETVVGTE